MSSNTEVQENGINYTTKEIVAESPEIKKRLSVDKISLKSDKEVEPDEGDTTEPPMTLRRFMVLFTLVWLVISSAATLSLIGPAIGSIHT